MKYLALLRGINVGGKNKVAMEDLRRCFERDGFSDVTTYIGSGNVFFETNQTSTDRLIQICEHSIENQFGFKVIVSVMSATELLEAMEHAPHWWDSGDKDVRSDALFVIPPANAKEVLAKIKVKSVSPDKFATFGQVIFWSLPMVAYNKSVVPKIIGTDIYRQITIRSSTTAKKLVERIR